DEHDRFAGIHADPARPAAAPTANCHPPPPDAYLPPFRLVDSPENVDEGRLPRAVFPHQRVHLTRQHLEVDAGKRLHPWKLLDDAPHPEDGLRDRGCLRSSGRRADGGHQNATPLRSNTLAYGVHSPVRMTPRTLGSIAFNCSCGTCSSEVCPSLARSASYHAQLRPGL